MSRLRIYDETRPQSPLAEFDRHATIAAELGKVGVRFEQWEAGQPIAPGASQDEVIAAYRNDIDRLMAEEGYQSADVISLAPDHPDRTTLRQKFLSEHTPARTRYVSSLPGPASSPCTWMARSTTSCASRVI